MKQTFFFIINVIFLILYISGCTKDNTEAQNIEQIHKEHGVPVRIEKIQYQPFESVLNFNAVLSGIEESSAYAKVSDKVEKIHVTIGDYVKKDAVILTFPTDNPMANYYQAKVAYENSKTAYERVKNLHESGGISLQDLDNAKAQYEVAKANWDAASQTIKVKAPISGYVTKLNVQETDNVNPGDELLTISRIDKMKAIVWISEKEICDVKKGLSAYAIWNNSRFDGHVVQVDLAMNQKVQAFQTVIELDNPDNVLKCGTTVDIKIQTYTNDRAIVIARKNILKQDGQNYVYVAEDGEAKKRKIIIGKHQGIDVEIIEGLRPGEDLIVEGQLLLEHGSKLNIIKN